jgi:hypothetical protein
MSYFMLILTWWGIIFVVILHRAEASVEVSNDTYTHKIYGLFMVINVKSCCNACFNLAMV